MDPTLYYFLGVLVAIFAGITNSVGMILQKKVVNAIPIEQREKDFFKQLLKNPVWDIGLFFSKVIATVFVMTSINMLGPILTPGLMATGLIFLALGSGWINHEKLQIIDWFGIILMLIGVTLLGFSGLRITSADLNFTDLNFLFRIALFSLILLFLWGVFHWLARYPFRYQSILKALAGGPLFSLSNFWISPLLATITVVIQGIGSSTEIIIFIIACILLVGTNLFGIGETQGAFKLGDASILLPIQNIPIQIMPVFIHFFVFNNTLTNFLPTLYLLVGVICIILSGFFLSRRQAQLKAIK